ncbi:MAG: extracellular solute-binding protein [Propionibacteriaceae bacterium]|jgi:raffinose/stachyose/melibiose transport system substrate-binding protein|nr:extracellular solute-binding protein [Propionibacteriaceae bacterium]
MRVIKLTAIGIIMAASTLVLSACATTADPGNTGDTGTETVELTWWHNATSDPLKGVWEQVAKEFENDHPGVKITVTGYQNEDLQRTLIPQALLAGGDAAPDVFMVWPGGEVRSQVQAGYLKDLTTSAASSLSKLGSSINPWQVDGKQYGVPYTFGIEGFWYNKNLFEEAGIAQVPTTLPELNDAVAKLKAINVAPIAVGAKDLWPAGHWWYQFALASCSVETLESAIPQLDFSDPCWVEAGTLLKEFVDTKPFQDGWLATSAQTGADSSAGLVANGNAGMELMGHWNSGKIGELAPGGVVPEFVGWFPMVSVPGAAGLPGIAMGGGDGWGVYKDAPDVAVELVAYIVSDDVQKRFAETGSGIPTNPAGTSGLTDVNLKMVADGLADATYVQLWLDSALGPDFGSPLNQAVVDLMAGKGTPESVVKALEDTAAKQ